MCDSYSDDHDDCNTDYPSPELSPSNRTRFRFEYKSERKKVVAFSRQHIHFSAFYELLRSIKTLSKYTPSKIF